MNKSIHDRAPHITESEATLARMLTHPTDDDIHAIMAKVSLLPWDISVAADDPQMVVVCDALRQVVAKCGPISDAKSSFDAILMVALVNRAAKDAGRT